MSRLTGTDAYGLMEAYNNVYAPQELTEEQVWEEVENWVNSLLEEGYDLSDYTWEEMYESYIEEQGGGRSPRASGGVSQDSFSRAIRGDGPARTLSASDRSRMNARPGPSPIPRMANLGAGYKSAELQQSAKASASQVGTTRTGAGGVSVGGGNAGATPAPATTKVAPAPARDVVVKAALKGQPGTLNKTTGKFTPNSSTPAQKPPTGTPPPKPPTATPPTATPPTGSPGGPKLNPTPAPSASPARPSLSSQADEIRKMRAGSLARQGKTLESSTVSGTAKPAYQANSFDPFDVVKGHLIDEGYADTEEAALAIMTNMSEEWRQSIVEGNPLPGIVNKVGNTVKKGLGQVGNALGVPGSPIPPTGQYSRWGMSGIQPILRPQRVSVSGSR
jgi:hypothetical protein